MMSVDHLLGGLGMTSLFVGEEPIINMIELPTLGVEVINSKKLYGVETSSCAPMILDANDACKPVLENGDSTTKLDILIIVDGVDSDAGAKTTATEIMSDTGFFSVQPFKRNKNKFNVWYLSANGQITYAEEEKGEGLIPQWETVRIAANKCPWLDYVILTNEKSFFRSFDLLRGKPGYSMVSQGGFDSITVVHEFGHAMGLVDEYMEDGTKKAEGFQKIIVSLTNSLVTDGPNCQPTKTDAQMAWGKLAENNKGAGYKVGYYKGCGGFNCEEDSSFTNCYSSYRPTENSIMKNDSGAFLEEGENAFGPFNEGFIEKEVLKKYS